MKSFSLKCIDAVGWVGDRRVTCIVFVFSTVMLVYASHLIVQHNVFGESAWTLDTDRQQFYYHAYSEDEPDLNLTNPAVIAELDVSSVVPLTKC